MGTSCPMLSALVPSLQDKLSRHLESGEITAREVAAGILGERCWIKWPYLQEAVVVAVSDGKQTVSCQMLSACVVERMPQNVKLSVEVVC